MNTQQAQLEHLLESAVGVLPASTASVVVLSRRQLMRGSWTKASSMAITLSLLLRSTRTTFSQVNLHRNNKTCVCLRANQQKRCTCCGPYHKSRMAHNPARCNCLQQHCKTNCMPSVCLAAFCDTLGKSWYAMQRVIICPCHQ